MEKPHYHSLLLIQVKVIYCLATALGLGGITALNLHQDLKVMAAIAAIFALLLVAYAIYLLVRRRHRSSPYPEWLLLLLLCAFTLFGMQQRGQSLHWMYLVPPLIFLMFRFKVACILAALYSVVLIVWVLLDHDLAMRMQLIISYLACTMFSLMYALINYQSSRGLHEIVNTDSLTQVYNQNQLQLDLSKEITLADRQNFDFLLLLLKIPSSWQHLKVEEFDDHLGYLGRKLKRSLRNFDTAYRMNNDDFIVMMPHSDESDFENFKVQLLQQLNLDRYPEMQYLVFHYVQYQQDDDQESLLDRLMELPNEA